MPMSSDGGAPVLGAGDQPYREEARAAPGRQAAGAGLSSHQVSATLAATRSPARRGLSGCFAEPVRRCFHAASQVAARYLLEGPGGGALRHVTAELGVLFS